MILNLENMFKFKKKNIKKEILGLPEAKEVKVSIIFTHLGEINTLKEIFSCEATLFISWRESNHLPYNFNIDAASRQSFDPDDFWNPQLYIDSKKSIR